jgi:hypothetical protein
VKEAGKKGVEVRKEDGRISMSSVCASGENTISFTTLFGIMAVANGSATNLDVVIKT